MIPSVSLCRSTTTVIHVCYTCFELFWPLISDSFYGVCPHLLSAVQEIERITPFVYELKSNLCAFQKLPWKLNEKWKCELWVRFWNYRNCGTQVNSSINPFFSDKQNTASTFKDKIRAALWTIYRVPLPLSALLSLCLLHLFVLVRLLNNGQLGVGWGGRECAIRCLLGAMQHERPFDQMAKTRLWRIEACLATEGTTMLIQ